MCSISLKSKIGVFQQLKQLGTNGFTRNFTYNTGHNTLQKVETPTPSLFEDFTYDACGNQLTAGTTRNYVWNAGNQLITYYNQAGSAEPTIFAQYDGCVSDYLLFSLPFYY